MARMRYAVFGGTFDPIHIGHLLAAEQVADALGLEKVFLTPAGSPWHKAGNSVSDAEHRYNMAVLAARDNPRIEVCRVDIERPGPTYSIDTIRLFDGKYGKGEVGFIIGEDALTEITTWCCFEDVMREASLVIIHRPGNDTTELKRRVTEEWLHERCFVEITSVDISSTQIRGRVSEGRSIRYLTPDQVVDYIRKERLYLPNT